MAPCRVRMYVFCRHFGEPLVHILIHRHLLTEFHKTALIFTVCCAFPFSLLVYSYSFAYC